MHRRLREPSTWAALAAAFTGLAATVPADVAGYCWGGVILSTVLGVILPESTRSAA